MTELSKRFINTDGDDAENGLTWDDIAVSRGSTLSIAQAVAAMGGTGGEMAKVLNVVDERPVGTFGGTSEAGENKRSLTKVLQNSIVGAYVSGGSVHVPAGAYLISAAASVVRCGVARAVIRAGGSPIIVGVPTFVDTAFGQGLVYCIGAVTLDVDADIELFSHNESGLQDIGLGSPVSEAGCPEVYASMNIVKI